MVGRIPSETNYDAFEADYLTYGSSALRSWVDVARSCQSLPRLMGYAALPVAFRSEIWARFAETEALGYVDDLPDIAACPAPDSPAPENLIAVPLTLAETIDSYASKIAHCFWLEKNKTFPWRLSSMSDEALSWLVAPDKVFNPFSSTTGGTLNYIVDHTPFRVWNQRGTGTGGTLEGFTGTLMADAVYQLGLYSSQNFVHVTSQPEYAYHADDLENLTYNGNGSGQFVFNRCYAMARIFAAWCRCLNIPADPDTATSYEAANHGQVRVYMDGRWWVTLHADRLGNVPMASTSLRSRTPRFYWTPWDDEFQTLGYGAGYKWYQDTYNDDLAPEMATWSGNAAAVLHLGGPKCAQGQERVGFIDPYYVNLYVVESWAYVTALVNHSSTAFMDNVKLRLIQITGEDN